MEDKPPPRSRKPDGSPAAVSLQDLTEYYLDQADEEKRQAVEAALNNPDSQLNAVLRNMGVSLRTVGSPPPPVYPCLADLPQEEIEAAEAKKRRGKQPLNKQHGPFRLIGPQPRCPRRESRRRRQRAVLKASLQGRFNISWRKRDEPRGEPLG